MRPKRDRSFYSFEVQELISECTHGGEFDSEEFDNKISGLKAAALVDGLDPQDFNSLVQQALKPSKLKVA